MSFYFLNFLKQRLTRTQHLFVCAMVMVVFPFHAGFSLIEVDVTRGTFTPIPIAFLKDSSDPRITQRTMSIMESNLKNSVFFNVKSLPDDAEESSNTTAPPFEDWKEKGLQFVVETHVTQKGGLYHVNLTIYDVLAAKTIKTLKESFPTHAVSGWREIAHALSDEVYQRITGEKGHFNASILYVQEKVQGRKKTARLAWIDQDGGRPSVIPTTAKGVLLNPILSPDGKKILFVSCSRRTSHFKLLDRASGAETRLNQFPGEVFAPCFSPDGKSLVFSLTKDGSTALYKLNLSTGLSKRLSYVPGAIETSPRFSPDGSKIIFNSDRSGRAALYIMSADGGTPQRISQGEGSYRTPVWSPQGDRIAFVKILDSVFYVGIMTSDGSKERLISRAHVVDCPVWSNNGRYIIFVAQTTPNSPYKLYMVDSSGTFLRNVMTPDQVMFPFWVQKKSPFQ